MLAFKLFRRPREVVVTEFQAPANDWADYEGAPLKLTRTAIEAKKRKGKKGK